MGALYAPIQLYIPPFAPPINSPPIGSMESHKIGTPPVSYTHLKDTTAWADKNGQKSITVTRGDVDGTQLFIAEVYQSSGASQPICLLYTSMYDYEQIK